jgi:hypothetical protein
LNTVRLGRVESELSQAQVRIGCGMTPSPGLAAAVTREDIMYLSPVLVGSLVTQSTEPFVIQDGRRSALEYFRKVHSKT